jgi:hypothetical protein
VGHQIVDGQDGVHAGYGKSGGFIDAPHLRMAVGAPDESRLEHTGQGNVVDEPGLAAQQRLIFQPLDGLSD